MTEYNDAITRIGFIKDKVDGIKDALGRLPDVGFDEDDQDDKAKLLRVLWLQEIIDLTENIIGKYEYIIENCPTAEVPDETK
jgi:hypothetical protein